MMMRNSPINTNIKQKEIREYDRKLYHENMNHNDIMVTTNYDNRR